MKAIIQRDEVLQGTNSVRDAQPQHRQRIRGHELRVEMRGLAAAQQVDAAVGDRPERWRRCRQREDGNRGERGVPAQLTQAVANILDEIVEPGEAALVAAPFLDLGEAAELPQCGVAARAPRYETVTKLLDPAAIPTSREANSKRLSTDYLKCGKI